MTEYLLIILLSPLALAAAFAIARITLRLRQPLSMAALSALVIAWQTTALVIGRAALASSVTLLFAACILMTVVQWLRLNGRIQGAIGASGYVLALLMAGIALLFPKLGFGEASAFLLTFAFVIAGVWLAGRRSRTALPAPTATSLGAPSLAIFGLWLLVHMLRAMMA